MITLYNNKKDCSGCSACLNVCPTQAISMQSDSYGYLYPTISTKRCVECGLCNRVCAFQNKPIIDKRPLRTYVAVNKSRNVLLSSSSGGVFSALANIVLENNGVVFGCAYGNEMEPKHVSIENKESLRIAQGSKYVQSNINFAYVEVKEYLASGRQVLFVGTPCQIAGLKSYLGKDNEKLITADLVCHGVASAKFFKGYIRHLEQRLKGKVVDFKFRDKSKGWGHVGKVIYSRKGKLRSRRILPGTSYYYSFFLKGHIQRESCYKCKYACGSREGDYTMGDYWGVKKFHPEIKADRGVSVLLVNSKKGMENVDEIRKYVNLVESSFEHASEHNLQLVGPINESDLREEILLTWRDGGHRAVAENFYRQHRKQIILYRAKMLIPKSTKSLVKMIWFKSKRLMHTS